jgi:hypothetical protein
MKIRLLFFGALLLVGGFMVGRIGTREVHAQTSARIPRGWGRCVGVVNKPGGATGLVFEDANGVVRITDLSGNAVVVFNRD